MEPSTLVRRSTRIASKNSVEPRAKRAYARANRKGNIYGGENSTVNKNDLKSVKISSLCSTGKTVLRSRNSTKSKDGNSLPPSFLDVKMAETNAVKLNKMKQKENSKLSPFDLKKSESSIDIVMLDQPRQSKRRLEKNDDLENNPIELINIRRNLASFSKKLATTKKKLIENGADKNKALDKLVTYKKNEIVMAKMAGHVIWPAKILDIDDKAVWVRFYGDYTTGKIFKSKLMKFESFMMSYIFEENKATPKLRLRHKGILEALHEKTFEEYKH